MDPSSRQESGVTFRDVFSSLSDQERREAERNFERYLEIALQICAEELSGPDVSDLDRHPIPPTMEERSNEILKN
jgi:hypothetical protein